MPTYTLTTVSGTLTAAQKGMAAAAITRVHNQVTGAATFFAQVIIHEVPEGNYFAGGAPLSRAQVFLNGQIRAGRSATDRTRLLLALRDAVASALGYGQTDVWVYLTDLPARDMIEYGHILPEPGGEQAWLDGLPAADRARMLATGESR